MLSSNSEIDIDPRSASGPGQSGDQPADPDATGAGNVADIHRDIGRLLIEIDRWESVHGPYDRSRDETRFDLRLKSLFDRLGRTPAHNEVEVMNKLERAIHVGGRGTPLGDSLIEGALHDLRRLRAGEKNPRD